MQSALLTVLAFGPSLIWCYWLWSRDKLEREPLGLIARLMAAGALLSVTLALAAELLLAPYVPTLQESALVHMLVSAALPEEIAKMLPVLVIAWRAPAWNEHFDGIVYAGASALGFHLTETALYMFRALDVGASSSLYQGLIRGAKPGHMLYGVVMGYFLSHARFGKGWGRVRAFAMALAAPLALHTAWNTASSYGGNFIGGETLQQVLVSIVAWGLSVALWVTAYRYMRQDRANSPFRPDARTVPLAVQGCPACGGGYPAGAVYCHSCGSPVG